MQRRLLRSFGWIAAFTLFSGCLAPTLPLPPPLVDALSFPDGEGMVTVSGQVRSRAFVTVLNNRTDEGVIARAIEGGRFATRIRAVSGDELTIYQMDGGAFGAAVTRIVPTETRDRDGVDSDR